MIILPSTQNKWGNYYKKFLYRYDELRIFSAFLLHEEIKDTSEKSYPFFYMNVLIKGNVTFVNEYGKEFPLKCGDVLFRHPNRKNILRRRNIEAGYEFVIRLPLYIYENLVGLGMIDPQAIIMNIGMDQLLVDSFREFIDKLGEYKPNELTLLIIEVQKLLYYLKSRKDHGLSSEIMVKKIDKACKLLSKNFEKKLTIPEIAKNTGLGYELFRKEFHRIVGVSPQEFRIRSRVEAADQMIRMEEYSLSEIADRLGYPDYPTFAKQYKKLTGHTPGAIKKKDFLSLLQ